MIDKTNEKRRCDTSTSVTFEHVIFKRVCQFEANLLTIMEPEFALCFRHESEIADFWNRPEYVFCRHQMLTCCRPTNTIADWFEETTLIYVYTGVPFATEKSS